MNAFPLIALATLLLVAGCQTHPRSPHGHRDVTITEEYHDNDPTGTTGHGTDVVPERGPAARQLKSRTILWWPRAHLFPIVSPNPFSTHMMNHLRHIGYFMKRHYGIHPRFLRWRTEYPRTPARHSELEMP